MMGMSLNPADWKPVFDYLEHETRFQAAAAAVTGGAAAWWLKSLLATAREPIPERYPRASRLAAGLLAASAALFLIDEGRVSKKYGELARMLATGSSPDGAWTSLLVRGTWNAPSLVQWSPYYGARALLFVVGAIVLWMLVSDLRARRAA